MKKYSDIKILKRLFLQARPYWPHIACIFILDLLATPFALLTPLPLKIAVDNVKYDVVDSYGALMDIVGSGE